MLAMKCLIVLMGPEGSERPGGRREEAGGKGHAAPSLQEQDPHTFCWSKAPPERAPEYELNGKGLQTVPPPMTLPEF